MSSHPPPSDISIPWITFDKHSTKGEKRREKNIKYVINKYIILFMMNKFKCHSVFSPGFYIGESQSLLC